MTKDRRDDRAQSI